MKGEGKNLLIKKVAEKPSIETQNEQHLLKKLKANNVEVKEDEMRYMYVNPPPTMKENSQTMNSTSTIAQEKIETNKIHHKVIFE